jgi:very-short-patch-repair endonuclease
MLPYNRQLKRPARNLRNRMTDAERALWARLRRKQIGGVQFYRQKPLGNFIVDFYAPSAHLIIEVDGAQHAEPPHRAADAERTAYLKGLGLRVIRFDNLQVLQGIEGVMQVIEYAVARRANPS